MGGRSGVGERGRECDSIDAAFFLARALEGSANSQFPRKAVVFKGGDRLERRF